MVVTSASRWPARASSDVATKPPSVGHYAPGFVTIAVAYETAIALDAVCPRLFFFLIAIELSAWFGGPTVGWLACALSIICAVYLLPPIRPERDCLWLLSFAIPAAAVNPIALKRRAVERHLTREGVDFAHRVTGATAEFERRRSVCLARRICGRRKRNLQGYLAC